jgi:hypothetical protein
MRMRRDSVKCRLPGKAEVTCLSLRRANLWWRPLWGDPRGRQLEEVILAEQTHQMCREMS